MYIHFWKLFLLPWHSSFTVWICDSTVIATKLLCRIYETQYNIIYEKIHVYHSDILVSWADFIPVTSRDWNSLSHCLVSLLRLQLIYTAEALHTVRPTDFRSTWYSLALLRFGEQRRCLFKTYPQIVNSKYTRHVIGLVDITDMLILSYYPIRIKPSIAECIFFSEK